MKKVIILGLLALLVIVGTTIASEPNKRGKEYFVKTTGEVKVFELDNSHQPKKLAIYVNNDSEYAYYIIEDKTSPLFKHIGEKTTLWGKAKTRLILDTIKMEIDTVDIWGKQNRHYYDTTRTIDTLEREILLVKSFVLSK
jgi:uncharacterized protein YxeA